MEHLVDDGMSTNISDLIRNIASRDDLFFKHQQINEADLTLDEKYNIVENLLINNLKVFLERYSSCLRSSDIPIIEKNVTSSIDPDDPIIQFYLQQIPVKHPHTATTTTTAKKSSCLVVKNRRFKKMNIMLSEGSYFDDDEMKQRDPLLYEQLVGQYLNAEEIHHKSRLILKRQRDDDEISAADKNAEKLSRSNDNNYFCNISDDGEIKNKKRMDYSVDLNKMLNNENDNKTDQLNDSDSIKASPLSYDNINDKKITVKENDNSMKKSLPLKNENNNIKKNDNNNNNNKKNITNNNDEMVYDPKLSTLLLRHLQAIQNNELYAKQLELEECCREESDEDDDDNNCDMDVNKLISDDEMTKEIINDRQKISEEEKIILREEFLSTMKQRFLNGLDEDFNYNEVDEDEQYDSLELIDKEEEEKYFEEDDNYNDDDVDIYINHFINDDCDNVNELSDLADPVEN